MKFPFDRLRRLVVIEARFWGPSGDTVARLALDTGATNTLISPAVLVSIGYDPAATADRIRVTTGSGVEFAARLAVNRLESLGITRTKFPVVCHTLPPSAGVDGLLGLDFLRQCRLVIDFRKGEITLKS